MTTYYKCTRPDGTDFTTGTIDYAAALVRPFVDAGLGEWVAR
jgi:hypothetical protein